MEVSFLLCPLFLKKGVQWFTFFITFQMDNIFSRCRVQNFCNADGCTIITHALARRKFPLKPDLLFLSQLRRLPRAGLSDDTPRPTCTAVHRHSNPTGDGCSGWCGFERRCRRSSRTGRVVTGGGLGLPRRIARRAARPCLGLAAFSLKAATFASFPKLWNFKATSTQELARNIEELRLSQAGRGGAWRWP